MKKQYNNYSIRIVGILLCLIMIISLIPLTVYASADKKVVRVGWYESPFNETDQFGRRSGYAYEFQQKIAAYTNWKYEYVEGSWSELMQMLINGEIDLMSDISYTEERSNLVLFSSYPMGTEEYYLFVSPDNTEYATDSFTWLNGKKVGINKGSVMIDMFLDWQEKNNVETKIIELTCTEEESIKMLHSGELDAYVILDVYGGNNNSIPVVKIGYSDFYFAVNKDRPDLLEDLNIAMSRIQDENRFYNQQLYDKYIISSGANVFLSHDERQWLSDHGPIRVGYRDDCMPFCDKDDKTQELTGVLKDYLKYASECFENARIDFEPVCYSSSETMINALINGEIDCIFPSGLSTYDSESLNLFMTPAIMKAEIYIVTRKTDQVSITSKEHIVAAIERGDVNYLSVIKDKYPEWDTSEYTSIQDSLKAINKGEVDVILISNYQYNYIIKFCERYNLTAIPTGEDLELYFAVKNGSNELYSVLTRTKNLVSGSAINSSLAFNSIDESKTSFFDFIKDNPMAAIAMIVIVIALVIVIIAQGSMLRIKKDAEQAHHQVDDLNKRVNYDALTSVGNKGAFDTYIKNLYDQIENKEISDIAIAIFDCNDLKMINDEYGHDKGDVYLKTSVDQICQVFKRNSVFRIGGDEFAVVLQDDDFVNREELKAQFEKNIESMTTSSANRWEQVSMAVGMADYNPRTDRSLEDTIRRADKNMYENKRIFKESR